MSEIWRRPTLRERVRYHADMTERTLAWVAYGQPRLYDYDDSHGLGHTSIGRLVAVLLMLAYELPYNVWLRTPCGSKREAVSAWFADNIAAWQLALPWVPEGIGYWLGDMAYSVTRHIPGRHMYK